MGTIAGLSLGWQVTQEWEIGQFRAIALEKDGVHPVLAVRGTTGALDWMENFDSGGVGFGEAEDAWNDTDLRDWLKANPTASLTGHSQGGAIAQILVEFMLDEATPMQGDVVTFNPAGINVGDDARDYSDLNEVLHFVSYGDIVSQVGDRFTPGEVHLYDFNAVGLFAPALLYTAHTEHWAQDALYDLAPFAETSEANWRGDAEDFTWLDDTRETTRLGGVTDTDTLGSGFYSNRSFRIGGDSEFLQFEAWIASLSPILSIPFVGLLTNRFTLESGRSLLGPLKEAVDTASDADSSSVDWLEENADTLVTSAALTDATAVAEVADDPAAIYHVRSAGSSLDIPTAQAAMTVASADTVDGLSVSGFDPTSSLLILDTTISAENASILRGSAIIHFDYDLDGETDATVTLEGDFNLGNFTFEDVGIGTEIRYTGNAAPEASPDTAVTSESAAITIGDLLDNDSDDDGDALAISSIDTAGTLGMVTLNGDGTVLYDPNGAFDGLLDGETATDTFTYIVSDGVDTSSGTVTVTITGEGPTVTPLNLITGTAGSNFLIGTDGQDALIGLGGSYDKLLGGDGADSFVFLAETDNGRRERDVIIDYEVGIDRIVLGTDTSIAAIRQTSTQVVVSLDGDRDAIYVRGEGVTADNLTIEFSDEFQFI